jgi:hypothetical protein
MAKIPAVVITQEDLNMWDELNKQIGKLKAAEMLLRMKIFHTLFPTPVEGTNSLPLTEGWVIKAKYPISRKVLADVALTAAAHLREAGIRFDELVIYKPELAVGEYRKLTAEQCVLFDQILEVKPGSPQLEIVLPKRAIA